MIYFVSFRIAERGNYDARYEELNSVIDEFTKQINWKDTTSFAIFESTSSTDDIVEAIMNAIDVRYDLVVLGSLDHKVCRVIGKNNDPDIFRIVPFAKEH